MTTPRIAAVGATPVFPSFVARALGMSEDEIVLIPSAADAERTIAQRDEPFDVVLLGPAVSEEEAGRIAEFMSREVPTTAVVVVRDTPVDGAFPRLIRRGARDVVDLTLGGSEFKDALARAIDWAEGVRATAPPSTNGSGAPRGAIVSVFSTKGGTGKTFLSVNLALALAERTGQRVAIVDLDHDLGDVFAYFGATPRRSLQELLMLEEGAGPEDVHQLGTPLPGGLTGFGSATDPQAEPMEPEAIAKMLRTMREAFAFTVVDATSEYSDHVLATFDLSDLICLISGLDTIGLRHMSIGMQTLHRLGVPPQRIRIVLNRADSKVDLTPQDVERVMNIRVNAQIPSSSLVPRSVNRGRALWLDARTSNVAKAIEAFADQVRSEFAPGEAVVAAPNRRWKRR